LDALCTNGFAILHAEPQVKAAPCTKVCKRVCTVQVVQSIWT